jgi:hypothetical protein
MKTPVSKALSASNHCSGYPLTSFLHAFVHGAEAINILTTGVRSAEEDKAKTPFERRFGKLPHSTDLYPFGVSPREIDAKV